MVRLDSAAISAALTRLEGWQRVGDTLEKTVTLPSFPSAIAFVDDVAAIAHELDHHPDILIQSRRVTLTLTTHDAGGLTDLDLDTAAAIDAVQLARVVIS
jgi:4a-hydroxytetrahydrobiopterin dehydratase